MISYLEKKSLSPIQVLLSNRTSIRKAIRMDESSFRGYLRFNLESTDGFSFALNLIESSY